jgi:hypothetical protein
MIRGIGCANVTTLDKGQHTMDTYTRVSGCCSADSRVVRSSDPVYGRACWMLTAEAPLLITDVKAV